MSRSKMRRGIGGVVGASLAIIIMISIALYAYANVSRPPIVSPDPLIRVLDEYLNQRIVIGPTSSGYYLLNTGSSPMEVEYLVLRDVARGSIALVKADARRECSLTRTVVPPGGLSMVGCGSGITLVAVLSSEGRIYFRDPRLTAPYLIPRAIPQKALLTPEIVSALNKYIEYIDMLKINSSIALIRLSIAGNPRNGVRLDVNASLVIALKSSPSPDKWNIIVAGYGAYGTRSNSNIVVGNGPQVNLSRVGALRFRVKIENLSITEGGEISVDGNMLPSPQIRPCTVNSGKQCWVRVRGTADRVVVYVNGTSPSTNVDLEPFFITGDLDGNGYPEFFFVTQDFSVGDSTRTNDLVRLTIGSKTVDAEASDASVRPIRIVFTNAPINNSRYATVIVSMRLTFWDSSTDDITDNENRIVFRVGVYDPTRSSYVYSVSLSYYELCRYRTVRPMTASYIVKDFILFVPSPIEIGNKNLYVAIDVGDPYDRQGTRNDAEIIVGIEYVGLVLGVRL